MALVNRIDCVERVSGSGTHNQCLSAHWGLLSCSSNYLGHTKTEPARVCVRAVSRLCVFQGTRPSHVQGIVLHGARHKGRVLKVGSNVQTRTYACA